MLTDRPRPSAPKRFGPPLRGQVFFSHSGLPAAAHCQCRGGRFGANYGRQRREQHPRSRSNGKYAGLSGGGRRIRSAANASWRQGERWVHATINPSDIIYDTVKIQRRRRSVRAVVAHHLLDQKCIREISFGKSRLGAAKASPLDFISTLRDAFLRVADR